MLPAAKTIPKELLPIFDLPIIEYVVQEAGVGGIKEIIFVTRGGKDVIENHFDANCELEQRLELTGKTKTLGSVKDIVPSEVKITSARQPDAKDLGPAISCARHVLRGEPFAVILPDALALDRPTRGDNFSFSQLMKAWEATGNGQVMAERVDRDSVESYGIVDPGENSVALFSSVNIRSLIEKPSPTEAPSDIAVLGRYILPADVLDILEDVAEGVGGEIQLTDALDLLLAKRPLNVFLTDADMFDCGNKRVFKGRISLLACETQRSTII